MTLPIDVTDPRVVKAYSHPLRIQILRRLEDRVASPHELANELGVPLATVSYHVRRLRDLELIELVGRIFRRGSVEHRYTARFHAIFSDEEWGTLPTVLKRAYLGGVLDPGWAHVVAAANRGGFDRADVHYSRTAGALDRHAWTLIADELKRTLARVEEIIRDSEERLARHGTTGFEPATVMLLHFAGPEPDEVERPPSAAVDELHAAQAASVAAPHLPDKRTTVPPIRGMG